MRSFDAESGMLALSDQSEEPLEVASLRLSARDGALLCRVKRELAPEGLLARFSHAAQSELLQYVDEDAEGMLLRLGQRTERLPPL